MHWLEQQEVTLEEHRDSQPEDDQELEGSERDANRGRIDAELLRGLVREDEIPGGVIQRTAQIHGIIYYVEIYNKV